MGDQVGPELIVSVERSLRLLEAVGAHEAGAPAQQLAVETGLPLAGVRRLLPALARDGYVTELDDGAFVLSCRHHPLGADYNGKELVERIRPVLMSLRDDFSVAVYLTMYEQGEIRVMEIVDSAQAPRVDLWVDFQDAGHATALGKSVLRELDEEARADYLSRHSLTELTPRTITRREELMRQLSSLTEPVVMDREEYSRGTTCAAVPVYSGDQVGSLGISFRSDWMYRTTRVRTGMLSAAMCLTRRLSLPD
ncbi:IclR family transcriptional regulator [Streptomyces sp. NRRL S-1824]|uniref:IclR family transcriptional regulator n=1 Tax=Streptomyces sp. NRRL S-1824 TaxID=1463889 RepID=UPI0004C6B9D1|nr:IclR family transcriptional regulator C-terminal domain-containing protein [Streptomyces sp. NRRL S-1824]